jgi:pimeloyl-ACP methyl ester carboxylesterase
MRRACPLLACALVAAAPAAGAPAASAATSFAPCAGKRGVQCAQVPVPIDRSGRVPGSISLHVERVPARSRVRAGAVIGLAGGPGQAAAPFVRDFAVEVRRGLRNRDLIVFDQRGTGRSGLLRCPSVERVTVGNPRGEAVRECAGRLGAGRAFYTTADSVEDIEAVRTAVGVDRVTLYGTSYGTKVALAYAARHPQHVERLLLDSVLPLEGPDAFSRDILTAVPRVLRSLCGRRACTGITSDPVTDLVRLVSRLRVQPLRGRVIGGDGKARQRRLGRLQLLRVLIDGDLDPSLRSELPGSVRSALRGDSAPLLRLAHRAALTGAQVDPPFRFSSALFVATVCEDGPLPWQPGMSFGDRWATAGALIAALPDSAFVPFDRATARATDTLRICAHWPTSTPQPPPLAGPLPAVPSLLLSGEADLRTPQEEAAKVAAQIPGSIHLKLPGTGHAALVNDLSLCASEAVDRFFAGRPVGTSCPRGGQQFRELFSLLFLPTPVAPRSLRELRAIGGQHGRVGRTAAAFLATLADGFFQELYRELGALPRGSVGGLRRGRIRADGRLDGYSYVPGVEVSDAGGRRRRVSLLDDRGKRRFRIRGPAAVRGALTLDNETLAARGRIGGRRIRLPGIDEVSGTAATHVPAAKSAWEALRAARAGTGLGDGCCRPVR